MALLFQAVSCMACDLFMHTIRTFAYTCVS